MARAALADSRFTRNENRRLAQAGEQFDAPQAPFYSRLRMAAGTMVLSPHLDDAVLSCWHVLAGSADVTVVTVFAGIPARDGRVPFWDRLTRATDSAARMRERLAENAEALELAGAASYNMDLLDAQYRPYEPPPAIAEALAEPLGGAATVYAPAALFPIPDHVLVLAAALELRREFRLYADLPHAACSWRAAWLPEWNASTTVLSRAIRSRAAVCSCACAGLAGPLRAGPACVPRASRYLSDPGCIACGATEAGLFRGRC
jgi:LmbE family N-acetylglucosaminyl deacetylase